MTTTPAPETVRQAWDDISPAYDRRITQDNQEVARRALDRVRLQPGDRFLDVASGSGALALAAASRRAKVTATDISPAMIERLRDRAGTEGLVDLEAVVMDGQDLDLTDDSFDVCGSQFGVMLFPDMARGLAEMARVTRPEGQVLMVTMGALPPKLEFLGFFLAAMGAVAPDVDGPFADGPPRDLQAADADVLGDRMAGAGLSGVEIETIDVTMAFTTGDELWDWVTSSNPVGRALVAGLSDEQGHEVRRVLDGMLRERATEGDGLLHNPVHVAVGTA
jgi:ubiquinone/menaquinone biosynthesis C-methylase UbiE